MLLSSCDPLVIVIRVSSENRPIELLVCIHIVFLSGETIGLTVSDWNFHFQVIATLPEGSKHSEGKSATMVRLCNSSNPV